VLGNEENYGTLDILGVKIVLGCVVLIGFTVKRTQAPMSGAARRISHWN
jgi:hypothetical protein